MSSEGMLVLAALIFLPVQSWRSWSPSADATTHSASV